MLHLYVCTIPKCATHSSKVCWFFYCHQQVVANRCLPFISALPVLQHICIHHQFPCCKRFCVAYVAVRGIEGFVAFSVVQFFICEDSFQHTLSYYSTHSTCCTSATIHMFACSLSFIRPLLQQYYHTYFMFCTPSHICHHYHSDTVFPDQHMLLRSCILHTTQYHISLILCNHYNMHCCMQHPFTINLPSFPCPSQLSHYTSSVLVTSCNTPQWCAADMHTKMRHICAFVQKCHSKSFFSLIIPPMSQARQFASQHHHTTPSMHLLPIKGYTNTTTCTFPPSLLFMKWLQYHFTSTCSLRLTAL